MKYMIHACNSRLWYVKSILIPDMLAQGIPLNDIILWNDYFNTGNQASFYNSCRYIKLFAPLKGGMWHLTDDAAIAYDFAERTSSSHVPNNLNIRCGFVTKKFNPRNLPYTGVQPLSKIWRSFPCVYIPNQYCAEFVDWYDKYDPTDHKYAQYKKEFEGGKDDDTLFIAYLQQTHPSIRTINITPALVDHIDYLIGGSTLFNRAQNVHRAYYLSQYDKNLIDTTLTKRISDINNK